MKEKIIYDNDKIQQLLNKLHKKQLIKYLRPIQNIDDKLLLFYVNNLIEQFNLGTEESEQQ